MNWSARDAEMYADGTGLVDVALLAKKYVLATYGTDSAEYGQIKGIEFSRRASGSAPRPNILAQRLNILAQRLNILAQRLNILASGSRILASGPRILAGVLNILTGGRRILASGSSIEAGAPPLLTGGATAECPNPSAA